jgi:beta-phosphoglucomutase
MGIKAAIFDLDGVIVDTAKYHYLAWKKLADKLGIRFNEKDNERFKGVSRMRCMEILLEIGGLTGKYTFGEMQKLASQKNEWYVSYISKLDENEILEGTHSCLEGFRELGVKIVLGSASKNAMLILNNLKLTPYFDSIIDGTKIQKAKPAPDVFLLGAYEVGVKPEECIVFEDAQAGIDAAKNAGMKAAAVGSPENLTGYDIIVKGLYEVNPREIINI